MKIIQASFLPDNDRERVLARPSVPVAKLIDGHWCWLAFGTDEYRHEPELERVLFAALRQARAVLAVVNVGQERF
jgi:hypothetical protein